MPLAPTRRRPKRRRIAKTSARGAFLSYFGPFDSEYRTALRSELCHQMEHELGYTGIAT